MAALTLTSGPRGSTASLMRAREERGQKQLFDRPRNLVQPIIQETPSINLILIAVPHLWCFFRWLYLTLCDVPVCK